MECNEETLLLEAMKKEVAARIRKRIEELGMKQAMAAAAAGMSPQRFGNYAQGTRLPDVVIITKIAAALNTSTDWLLGVSEDQTADIREIIEHLLKQDGIPMERAEAIAEIAQEAQRILLALPREGDRTVRSRIAAQAAWQSYHGSKQA